MARTSFLGQHFPFGLAFVSASPYRHILSSSLGVFLGFLFIISTSISLKYIISLIIFIFFVMVFKEFKKNKKYDLFILSFCTIINFICGIFILNSQDFSIKNLFFCISESLICGIASYIFRKGYILLKQINKKEINHINKLLFIYLYLMTTIILAPTLEFKLFNISIIKCFIITFVLSLTFVFGVLGASIAGSLQSIIYYVSNEENRTFFYIWHFASLFCSMFYEFGKFFISVAYFISSLIMYFWFDANFSNPKVLLSFIFEYIIGVSIFFIIPDKTLMKLKKIINNTEGKNSIHFYILQKLYLLSETFNKVSEIIEIFSKKISIKGYRIDSDDRILFRNNLKNLSGICNDLSHKIQDISMFDEEICAKLNFKLRKLFGQDVDISCRYNSINKTLIQISINKNKKDVLNKIEEIVQEISITCGKALSIPEFFYMNERILIRFYEKPAYNACVKINQKSYKNSKHCGDCYTYFLDGLGNFFALLNDGEGTGELASIDGNFVGQIIKKLVRSEVNFETAVEIANSALIIESERETSSTVDLFTLDLFTGKSTLIKAGATSTFIYKNGKIENISKRTLPIGILSNIKIEETIFELKDGDAILMVSDGVTGDDQKWIEPIFEKFHQQGEILVNKVVNMAEKKLIDNSFVSDDITAMYINISK